MAEMPAQFVPNLENWESSFLTVCVTILARTEHKSDF